MLGESRLRVFNCTNTRKEIKQKSTREGVEGKILGQNEKVGGVRLHGRGRQKRFLKEREINKKGGALHYIMSAIWSTRKKFRGAQKPNRKSERMGENYSTEVPKKNTGKWWWGGCTGEKT